MLFLSICFLKLIALPKGVGEGGGRGCPVISLNILLYLRDSIVTKFASYYFNVLVIILAKNGFLFDFSPT